MRKNREAELDLFEHVLPTKKPLFRVIFGNDMDCLSERLGEELFCSTSHPFENRLIVVPDIFLKEFLLYRFASHPRLKIAAGVQVYSLNRAVSEIIDQTTLSNRQSIKKRIPTFLELTLAIEEKLWMFLSEKSERGLLFEYLNVSSEEKRRKRISSLSDELAKLFGRYGLHGASFLPNWLNQSKQGWQQTLWREIYANHSPWTYPLELLKIESARCTKEFPGKISLFGFSHIAPVYLSYFCSLGASLYQLSPCALFWDDMASDKERLFVSKILKNKGVKEIIREEIDQYMQQGHPLLSNWGKLGREFFKSLDGFELVEDEVYREPTEKTLLADLKKSLLTLDESSVIQADNSIQVHSATSRLREVEILRDTLETLLQSQALKGDLISPSEILVVSPHIALYSPYIQMVLAKETFPYGIEGIPIVSLSEAVQGFLQLFKLKEERFAEPALIKLFLNRPFAEKNGFTFDEVTQLSKWFNHAEIRENLSSSANSWEAGIDRLLYGIARVPRPFDILESWPVATIPQSEIHVFNRFLELFEKIKNDLHSLVGEKSAAEWLKIFLQMADTYFQLEWENESFFQQLRTLSISCREFKQQIWTFESIQRVLFHLAQNLTGEIASPQLQKITFTSLRQGSLRKARIIWCLGMDEGTYPRADFRNSLCEMSRLKTTDYCPSKMDEDRSLFLDLFVKAQDFLIFSYQRVNLTDSKQQGPCILIEELNQYLKKRGIEEGLSHLDHPAFPFDSSYFSIQSPVKKWSDADFRAAKSHYSPHFASKPFFALKETSPTCDPLMINIRDLKKLARHPLQFYFNATLKIYLSESEDKEEKEFLISHLRKSILRKKATRTKLPQILHQLKAEGKLPSGLFQEAAWQDFEEDVRDVLTNLASLGIRSEEIQTVHLSPSCIEHEKSEILLPPLEIPLSDSRTAFIVGKLEDVTAHGLLFHGENTLKSLVMAWPLYLVYLCLHHGSAKLLLTKKAEELALTIADPQAVLASYIEYFLLAKNSPSPLMPDWASALLLKEEVDFVKAMSKELSYEDPYLNYLQRRKGLFDAKEAFATWSAQLCRIFAPLLKEGEK